MNCAATIHPGLRRQFLLRLAGSFFDVYGARRTILPRAPAAWAMDFLPACGGAAGEQGGGAHR